MAIASGNTPATMPAIETRPVLEYLRTRRSPKLKLLAGPAPNDDRLAQMLEIASRVPDHGRLVPWRFVIIRGQRRDDLNRVIGDCFEADHPDAPEEQRSEARRRMSYAPLVVAVVYSPAEHPKIPAWEQMLATGAVCMNLLHAARALGFAGLWLTEWYAFDRRVLAELSVAEHEQLAGFIHIGRNDEPREDRARPDVAAITTDY
ncbi:MAG: nitroreductase [Planctomycetota bacterium]